ncbi:hypothetical protein LSUB1_G003669 [Lachnellula subtilissima]|uniref:BZIP domain-containing protein n=1 Tax=Lachnellula subtilissima TaxID=602034 RepID=A0A8H8RT76_9HELO|nr:hypothetical protein LSUB1_G003669 [Lachnellula subtilissima]
MPPEKVSFESAGLKEVWRADDDWTELMTKEERKKRQNRLNQRSYRRRHAEKDTSSNKQPPFRTSKPRPSSHSKRPKKQNALPEDSEALNDLQVAISDTPHSFATIPLDPLLDQLSLSTLESDPGTELQLLSRQNDRNPVVVSQSKHTPATYRNPTAFDALFPCVDGFNLVPLTEPSQGADHDTLRISPDASQLCLGVEIRSSKPPGDAEHFEATSSPDCFPLSSDHFLHLVHQNVYRALIANKSLLSNTTFLIKVELNIVLPVSQNFCDGVSVIRSKPGEAIPQSLQPSNVQMNIAHSSWLNMFPHAVLRDNLIRHERDFDHGDLCNDLFGELFTNRSSYCSSLDTSPSTPESSTGASDPWEELEDSVTSSRRGFIVWGDSWDTENWEITPGFMRKWPWVLEGCEDLIASTNRWRAKRYEEPLAYPFSTKLPAAGPFENLSFVQHDAIDESVL